MSGKKNQPPATEPEKKVPTWKDFFFHGLVNGMTFLEACEHSGTDPKEITELFKHDLLFQKSCKDYARQSITLYLSFASEEEKAGRYHKAIEARERARNIGTKINTWGSLGTLGEKRTDQVIRIIRSFGNNLKETACALGCTAIELETFMEENEIFDLLEHASRKGSW